MKIVLVNIPNTRRDANGNVMAVGPHAGSRWPFLGIRPGSYAPFPFFMNFAASYLQANGFDVEVLDFVATQKWFPRQWSEEIMRANPEVVVLEISMPLAQDVLAIASAIKEWGKKVVLCGPHCASAAESLAALPYVDHVIVGEYEIPLLKIASGDSQKIYRYEHVEDLDTVLGKPWHPYRDGRVMEHYYDPSVDSPKVQLTVNTSRGCFAKCNYCQWPKVMNNRTYRARSVPVVLDEIRTAIALAAGANRGIAVRSIFFDDDTWGIGGPRLREMCAGLKAIGLPWSNMTRLDIHKHELFDLMFDSGAVAIRAGVESFQKHVVETTNGSRDAQKQYDALKYVAGKFKGIEIHLTSMRDMPGQSEADWRKDQEIFEELRGIAERNGNRLHYQISRCQPFPGTDLYNQMIEAGHGAVLATADYNGTGESPALNEAVRGFVPLSLKR